VKQKTEVSRPWLLKDGRKACVGLKLHALASRLAAACSVLCDGCLLHLDCGVPGAKRLGSPPLKPNRSGPTGVSRAKGESAHLCPIPLAKGRLYPEEVSAYVLAKLIGAAEEFTGGQPISKAVISVPAYFTDAQVGHGRWG